MFYEAIGILLNPLLGEVGHVRRNCKVVLCVSVLILLHKGFTSPVTLWY
jgi:hypothetical protein